MCGFAEILISAVIADKKETPANKEFLQTWQVVFLPMNCN